MEVKEFSLVAGTKKGEGHCIVEGLLSLILIFSLHRKGHIFFYGEQRELIIYQLVLEVRTS